MFGDHAAYIVPAYAASAVVIVALIIWLRLQFSSRNKELAKLEQSGIKRRADQSTKGNSI
ncbi:MAG: heme exporter protein CcmD [Hyphomicrobiales bacterium]|nr:heme exporter protein CcmD [Hyphomicrobiales bacterium]